MRDKIPKGALNVQVGLVTAREQQSRVAVEKRQTHALLDAEPSLIDLGETEMIAHASASEFDLRSQHTEGASGPAENRAIWVKRRAGDGAIEVNENEWAAACALRNCYWLYVIFDCATSNPWLLKIRNPFSCLLAKDKGGVVEADSEILSAGIDEVKT